MIPEPVVLSESLDEIGFPAHLTVELDGCQKRSLSITVLGVSGAGSPAGGQGLAARQEELRGAS